MRKWIMATLVLGLIPALGWANDLVSIGTVKMQNIISGKTISMHTLINMGTPHQPIYIQNDLKATFNANGTATGDYKLKLGLDSKQDQGKWTINSKGALCVTWQIWTKGQQRCYYAYPLQRNYLFVDANGALFGLLGTS